MLLGENVHWQDREAWVYSKNVYTRYPFQGALYGLPPEVAKECIIGAIEARFGSIAPAGRPWLKFKRTDAGACKAESLSDCCARWRAGKLGLAQLPSTLPFPDRARSTQFRRVHLPGVGRGDRQAFRDSIQQKALGGAAFGNGNFVAGRPGSAARSRRNDRRRAAAGGKPMGPNARFGYPLRGGFQAMMYGFLPHFKGKLELNANVAAISAVARIASRSPMAVKQPL